MTLAVPMTGGYPVRAIRTTEFFYSHNYNPERWPAGNPETDFGNCDPSPTKEWLKKEHGPFYDMAFGYRPEEELYDLKSDPQCLKNLAAIPMFADIVKSLRSRLDSMLVKEKDPRALGNGAIFDTYQYLGSRKKGYETWEAAQRGQLPEVKPKKLKKK